MSSGLPARSIGLVVECWKNSGTISTRPATLTVASVSTIIRPTLRSIRSCFNLLIDDDSSVRSSRFEHRCVVGLLAGDGLDGVVKHQEHAEIGRESCRE